MHEIGVLALHGVVQHYDWGGHDFIPGLLGITNSDGRPFAELWMGAHPKAPATAEVAGVAMPLDCLIAEAPDRILGLRDTDSWSPSHEPVATHSAQHGLAAMPGSPSRPSFGCP
jgi:hypothetical protein